IPERAKMKALTFLILCFASIVLADDFKTINGQEYKNVTVSRVEPDGIVITFSGGIVKIPFTEMSPEIQKKYGYDPKAAGDFQQQDLSKAGLSTKYYEQIEAGRKRDLRLSTLEKSRRIITSNCLRGDMSAALEFHNAGQVVYRGASCGATV